MAKKKTKFQKVTKATIKGLSTKIKPAFKKPKLKIKKLSATKLIEQMGKESSGRLVREVENPYADPIQDNRSQFFREEFKTEKKKAFGGFI